MMLFAILTAALIAIIAGAIFLQIDPLDGDQTDD
jgi:hypothetical protein